MILTIQMSPIRRFISISATSDLIANFLLRKFILTASLWLENYILYVRLPGCTSGCTRLSWVVIDNSYRSAKLMLVLVLPGGPSGARWAAPILIANLPMSVILLLLAGNVGISLDLATPALTLTLVPLALALV